jgi:CRISPR/Cas system CSM-associated protein Csm5 (group 7 of RAMP superfamily)
VIDGYQKYKLTLTCLGPVHIGSGQVTHAQDYIIINKGKTAFFPDMGRLYRALDSEQRKGLEDHFRKLTLISKDEKKVNRGFQVG